MEIKRKIKDLEYEYSFDQRELGKILFIVSVTLLVVSLSSFYQTRSTIDHVQQLNSDFEQLDAVVNTERFNQSLSDIESLQGSVEGTDFQYAVQTFQGMQYTLEQADKAEEKLQYLRKLYQWLTLISLLGATAGLTVIFI